MQLFIIYDDLNFYDLPEVLILQNTVKVPKLKQRKIHTKLSVSPL